MLDVQIVAAMLANYERDEQMASPYDSDAIASLVKKAELVVTVDNACASFAPTSKSVRLRSPKRVKPPSHLDAVISNRPCGELGPYQFSHYVLALK